MPYRFNFHTKKSDYYERSVDVTTAGLVLAMNFNPETLLGPAGSEKVLDSSGYNNHGQNHGATAVFANDFNNGGAFSFAGDGADNRIDVNTAAPLHSGQYTIEGWAYPLSVKTDFERTIAIDVNNHTFYLALSDRTLIGGSKGWIIGWYDAALGWVGASSNENPADYLNKWAHVIGTYDGSQFKIYVNGQLKNSNSVSVSGSSGLLTRIGWYDATWPMEWHGRISKVCIYNRAITADEVKQLYLQRKEIYNSFVSQKNVYVDSAGNVAVNKTTANASFDVNGFILHNGKSYVSTQFDKTADTTLEEIPGLSVNLVAGKYKFTVNLFVNADAIGGHKYSIEGTIASTNIIYQINSISNTTNLNVINSRQTVLGGSAGQAGATVIHTVIEGFVIPNLIGTLTCQFAQNVANGTSSVLVGSNMIVEQIS